MIDVFSDMLGKNPFSVGIIETQFTVPALLVISEPDWQTSTINLMFTGATTSRSVNVQFSHALDRSIYVYAFGPRVGALQLTGITFGNYCPAAPLVDKGGSGGSDTTTTTPAPTGGTGGSTNNNIKTDSVEEDLASGLKSLEKMAVKADGEEDKLTGNLTEYQKELSELIKSSGLFENPLVGTFNALSFQQDAQALATEKAINDAINELFSEVPANIGQTIVLGTKADGNVLSSSSYGVWGKAPGNTAAAPPNNPGDDEEEEEEEEDDDDYDDENDDDEDDTPEDDDGEEDEVEEEFQFSPNVNLHGGAHLEEIFELSNPVNYAKPVTIVLADVYMQGFLIGIEHQYVDTETRTGKFSMTFVRTR